MNKKSVLVMVLPTALVLVWGLIKMYLDEKKYEDIQLEYRGMEALYVFENSLKLGKRIQCRPEALGLIENYLEIGSVVDVNNGEYRYEKDSLKGDERLKWGAGIITSKYLNYDSCYHSLKRIEVDNVDSVTITEIDRIDRDETRQYVGKRQNGIVTECSVCRMENGLCKDTISVERIELNPISGKLEKRFYKTKYSMDTKALLYDSLGRLVEAKIADKIYRYEHFTNDTANFDIKMFDKTKRELGFYRITYKNDGNLKIVQNKIKNSDKVVTSIYENGKIKLKESTEKNSSGLVNEVTLFNSAGDVIYDSSYSEGLNISADDNVASSYVVKMKYGSNGKIETIDHYEEWFNRAHKKYPWMSLGLKKIETDKFYSGKLDNVEECKEPLAIVQRVDEKIEKLLQDASKPKNSYDNWISRMIHRIMKAFD